MSERSVIAHLRLLQNLWRKEFTYQFYYKFCNFTLQNSVKRSTGIHQKNQQPMLKQNDIKETHRRAIQDNRENRNEKDSQGVGRALGDCQRKNILQGWLREIEMTS